VIIDGDLAVAGNLDWWDGASGNFLLVTGNVTAANVILSGCPELVVRGDLTVTGGVQGSYGDDGGVLTIRGWTRARFVMSSLYFCMYFDRQPEALHIGDRYRTNQPVDFDNGELDDLVVPDRRLSRASPGLGRCGQPRLRKSGRASSHHCSL
jgi:hypothetical protein